MENKKVQVSIIMGSKSDWNIMQQAQQVLDDFHISNEAVVLSAHRTPEALLQYIKQKEENGLQIIIAGAGFSAHLAGVCAAHTTIPVLGVPIDSSPLNGLDSLLSTVQMPGGIPVATFGIGKSGAKNAAYFAISILATGSPHIKTQLEEYRKQQSKKIQDTSLD